MFAIAFPPVLNYHEAKEETRKNTLQLNVFFTPSAILPTVDAQNDIYIVIDVIRATTTLAVMFDQGAVRVFAASSVEQAREAATQKPERLLCGERNVQPLPGFDYGNSPVQFTHADLSGRDLILTTTNGTRAFYACPESSIRLAGCFYNAGAVIAKALLLTEQYGTNIRILCAGEYGHFSLDDVVCAGYLAQEVRRQYEIRAGGKESLGRSEGVPSHVYGQDNEHSGLQVDESALAAIALYEAFKPPKVLECSVSAQSVFLAGLPDDPPFCMQTNMSQSVPRVVGREEDTGLLIITVE